MEEEPVFSLKTLIFNMCERNIPDMDNRPCQGYTYLHPVRPCTGKVQGFQSMDTNSFFKSWLYQSVPVFDV